MVIIFISNYVSVVRFIVCVSTLYSYLFLCNLVGQWRHRYRGINIGYRGIDIGVERYRYRGIDIGVQWYRGIYIEVEGYRYRGIEV